MKDELPKTKIFFDIRTIGDVIMTTEEWLSRVPSGTKITILNGMLYSESLDEYFCFDEKSKEALKEIENEKD